MHQGGIKEPLAKQVEDAVDLGPGRSWQRSGLPAALAGAGQQGRGGCRLLLLLVGHFARLPTAALYRAEMVIITAVANYDSVL